jgi:HAD superfamily hydrolase (TIGR01549 family)
MPNTAATPIFAGVIFDMDGTLTLPAIDFPAIRRELGIPAGDLIVSIDSLPAEARRRAWAVVEAHEERAVRAQRLQNGAAELLAECRRQGVRLGLVTRNSRRSVESLCQKFGLQFDAAITREFRSVKPDPGPVLHVLSQWEMPPARALVVGDYRHDIECGRAAGAKTCFFQNPGTPFYGEHADFVVASMAELRRIVLGG